MSQNPKPRRLISCRRHPDFPTATGLCGPCLHERLSFLTPSTSSASPNAAANAVAPELRRCKTFSAKNRDDVVLAPGRRSCDVGGCGCSLSALFDQGKDDNGGGGEVIGSKNVVMTWPIPEVDDEGDEDEDDDESVPEATVAIPRVSDLGKNEGDMSEFEEGKTMKVFIDLELKSNSVSNNRKDFKEIAGSFLSAASVFSKKLRKWQKKQECSSSTRPSDCNGNGDRVDKILGELRVEDLRGRRLSYTQSEVGDYGFGRRSCDTDTRGGSVVLGRASIDCGAFGRKSCDSDPRFSIDIGKGSGDESKREFVDAPRVSWDGYLVGGGGGGGGRVLSNRGNAPVVSVIENAMATVYGFDDQVLGEGKVRMSNGGDEKDSSVRRRDGFDRCSSVKTDVVVMSEDKGLSNAKVSPAAIGLFNGTKLLITEKELNEWRLNSLKDDSSESYETASKDLGSVSSSSVGKDEKKCRQWNKLRNFWGSLNRRKRDKFGDDEELTRGDGPRPDEMTNGNKGGLVRSYSTSSSRGSSSVFGSSNVTTTRTDSKAIVKRRPDDSVLERSRSGRYSPTPNNIDNGLLQLYLTPLRSRRRNRLGKGRLKK
ncbi:protein OCTOPUS-like [Silene latifolia]|uniref:protein OCTOPUS-like n=1 Tax=Silene latifolia TaxID=37657 RepID=UPI003D77753C